MLEKIISRLSLRTVLGCMVIIPLALTMAFTTYYGLNSLEKAIEARLQEHVELVARAIRMPVSYSLEKERIGSLNQALESVFSIGRVYGAYVYDSKGKRIAAVGAVTPAAQSGDIKQIVQHGERTGQYEEIEGQEVFSYFVPLFDSGGNSNGLLQISRKKSDIESYIYKVRTQTIVFLTLASLFIGGLVLFGFYGAVGRYLSRIAATMTRVSSGERMHRASTKGPKEIKSLSKALNYMLDSISHAEKEIAERKGTQQELEEKLRQSEKMAAIGQLASGVAHELGTPLSVIDGKAQRCLRDKNLQDTLKSGLQDIRNEVQRMEHIVRQLLDFGRSSKQHRRWVHAANMVKSAFSLVRQEMSPQAEILLKGPEPGPLIYVDPLRIEQILINLLRNALQAEKVSKIIISWHLQDEERLIFRVEDNGMGITKEIRNKLFEPFFSTKKVGQGTGLGLSVVHGIVKEHGGEVYVSESSLGGACLAVDLPLNCRNCKKSKTGVKHTDYIL